jgi:hypothetical protein
MMAKRAVKTQKAKTSASPRRPVTKVTKAAATGATIFISYRHEQPTAAIARKLFTALVPATEVWNADVFMDTHDIEPADLFDQKILEALDKTTHFVVLLTNSYWSSNYCRKELSRIVQRFEKIRTVRLLFVKVDELDPNHFTFTKDRTAGRIRSNHPVIDKIGDVQFLGPFNNSMQLVRLQWENEARLGDQIAQLIQRLERVIAQ